MFAGAGQLISCSKGSKAVTEAEWLGCTDLYPMLIHLRGEVEPPESEPDTRPRLASYRGDLVWGTGKWVTERKLGLFAVQVCKKWWDLPLDERSRQLVIGYETFLAGESSWDDFVSLCAQVWDSGRTGQRPVIYTLGQWSLTPYGMANLTQELAWVTASHRHRDRIEELERTASEDELFAWGFFGYDFPEFGATAREILDPLPALLREVVGNPFRPLPRLGPAVLGWNGGCIRQMASATFAEPTVPEGTLAPARLAVLADALEEAGCTDTDLLTHLRSAGRHVRGCWALDAVLGKG